MKSIFFNTPARLKFMKSPATELAHIINILHNLALAYFSVGFRLIHNKSIILDIVPSKTLKDRVSLLFGEQMAAHLIPFSSNGEEWGKLYGFIGEPSYTRSDRMHQFKRPITSKSLNHVLYEAYNTLIPRGRYPVGMIFLDMRKGSVDVNVHPAKKEVRFQNARALHNILMQRIREALSEYKKPAVYKEAAEKFSFEDRQWEKTAEFLISEPSVEYSIEGMDREERKPKRYIQFRDAYIILEEEEGIVIIDQHAVAERIFLERFMERFEKGIIERQGLLFPITVELDAKEASLIQENADAIRRMDFEIEWFGGGGHSRFQSCPRC